jgi:hypothetical protein
VVERKRFCKGVYSYGKASNSKALNSITGQNTGALQKIELRFRHNLRCGIFLKGGGIDIGENYLEESMNRWEELSKKAFSQKTTHPGIDRQFLRKKVWTTG